MPKPTLLQTLLRRPSQTYLDLEPQTKDYFLVKPELLRIAAEAKHWEHTDSDFNYDYHNENNSFLSSSSTTLDSDTTMAPMASPPLARREPRDPPPRAAGATVAAAMQQRQPSISAIVAQKSYQQTRQQRTGPTNGRPPISLTDDELDLDGFDSSGEEDLDIFYTPNQSPRTSMASSSILFPSRSRNTTPRQASRKSLRTSNASSGVNVAPGIAASNSGSSIQPSLNHVNNGGSPATTTTTQRGAQQQQQQQQRQSQQRPSPMTPNGTASKRPAPQTVQATLQQQQPTRKRSIPSATAQDSFVSRPAPALTSSSRTNSAKPPAPETAQASTSKALLQQKQQVSRKPSIPSATSSPTSSSTITTRSPEVQDSRQAPASPLARAAKVPLDNGASASGSSSSTPQQPSRKPSISSAAPSSSATGTRPLSQATTPSRTNSVKVPSYNSDGSPNFSRATSTSIRSTTTSPNSSFTAPASNPTPKQKTKARPTSLSPSTISLSSTTLENHSDIFSATNGSASDMLTESTTVSSPLNSSDSSGRAPPGAVNRPAAAPLVNGAAKSPPLRSPSLRASRAPLPPRAPQPSHQAQVRKSYAYTDDDWAKDVRLLVNLHSALEETLNEEERLANESANLKRKESTSSRKDEQRKSLGHGQPAESKGKEPAVDKGKEPAVDKGKAKEKDSKEAGKIKRKKTTTSEEVVYYTAKLGTPRPPPVGPNSPMNGATNGLGSPSTRTFSAPVPVNQQPPKVPASGRNGYTHPPSIMMNMSALMEVDESSDGRLSAVTERDEPETPTAPSSRPTTTNGESHLSGVFNAFAPLRPTANNNAQPVEMMRRRSRSVGEHDAEERPPRQTSVASWADDYHDVLAKARTKAQAQAMASGTSLLSSPSQNSFAYRNAMPVPSGELPSQGTPGYSSLHLARAPPGVFAQDGEVHNRLDGGPQGGGLLGGFKGAVSGGNGAGVNGRVDLTRSGIAQTSMASVEVVKGLGSVKRGLSGVFSLAGLGRRRTVSGGEGMDLLDGRRKRVRKGSEDVSGSGHGGQDSTSGNAGSFASPDRVLGFTGYRRPPTYVPSGSVLVQVWAVGVDGVDAKLVGLRMGKRQIPVDDEEEDRAAGENGRQGEEGASGGQMNGAGKEGEMNGKGGVGRSMSLRSRLGSISRRKGSLSLKGGWKRDAGDGTKGKGKARERTSTAPPISHADVGYIPGRSFVGRVLDCGWDVRDETVRKGEWVIGLLDVRKAGALTEFIVVDRHRIHRVPYPGNMPGSEPPAISSSSATTNSASSGSGSSGQTAKPAAQPPLSFEQMALLPLCGVPAYRAVRTLMYAFSSQYRPPTSSKTTTPSSGADFLGGRTQLLSDHEPNRRRRALVLRGHDGVGAMAVQMLALRGWRVSVHIPVSGSHDSEDVKRYMREAEERVAKLGGEEMVFDEGGVVGDPWWDDGRAAAVRLIDVLREDGDVFDAVIDTLGGKEIREASERLLKSHGADEESGNRKVMVYLDGQSPEGKGTKKSGMGQFTTIVGEVPERVIPTTADNFRAGLRSLKFGSGGAGREGTGEEGGKTKVGYAWISVAQDVDWEGDNIAESIGNVLRLAMDHNIRPIVQRNPTTDEYSPEYEWQDGVMPLEKTPEAFVNGDGPLSSGGTMVIKVAA